MRKLGCGKPFTRQNGELLCTDCLLRMDAVPPTTKENVRTYLNAHGMYEAEHVSMGHGQHVGGSRIATFAVSGEQRSLADVKSMADLWEPDQFDEWDRLTGPERREVLQRFIDASPAAIEAMTQINRGTIFKYQQLAAKFLNPDPHLRTAREFLGVTADDFLDDIGREIGNLFKMAIPARAKAKTDADNPAIQEWRQAA